MKKMEIDELLVETRSVSLSPQLDTKSLVLSTPETPATSTPTEPWFPIYDPFILGDNSNYEVQSTCFEQIISDLQVLRFYLAVRDAFPTKALKHTRVLALSGMTIPAVQLFRASLAAQTERNPSPIDMYFYSDYKIVRYVDATLAIPLISLSEFTRPSRIVFGDGSFQMEGFNTLIQWMIDNRDKGYFKNLEYLQVTGHKTAAHDVSTNVESMITTIVSNLHTMCTDKMNFPKLIQMNFNSNAYNEYNDGFDAALRGACNRDETGVSIRAMQVTVIYPSLCSTINTDNLEYYDMSNNQEVNQCRFTWNWEMGDTFNTYGDGPYPNDETELCDGTTTGYPPSNVHYSTNTYLFLVGVSCSTGLPSYQNRVLYWSIEPAVLPEGLVFNGITGLILGTPVTIASPSYYTIQASNSFGSDSVTISIEVIHPLISYNQTTFILSTGVFFSLTPTLSEFVDVSIVSGSLPSGLSIHASTGVISGIPTQTVTSQTITVQAENSVNNKTFSLTFTIRNPITSFSYSQSEYIIAQGQVFSVTPLINGEGAIFSIESGSLPSGLVLNSSTGTISGTPSQLITSRSVTIKAENEVSNQSFTLVFTVITPISSFSYPQSSFTIPRNEAFTCTPLITGYNPSYSIISGSLPMGLVLNSSTGVISGIPIQSVFFQAVTIQAQNAASSNSFVLSFSVLLAVTLAYPQSSYSLLRNYDVSISPFFTGDSPSFSIQSGSLPYGIILNSSTGVISGTPTQVQSSRSVIIKIQNSISSELFTLSFTVLASISLFSYPQSYYVFRLGQSVSIVPNIDSSSVVFTIVSGSLPSGLSIHTSTGVISGIPTQTVTSQTITVQAENSVNNKTFSLTFTIRNPITSFSYSQSEYIIAQGQVFSVTPLINGEGAIFSIESGSLPSGLVLNSSTGTISGTPSQLITSRSVTIKAENEVSNQSFTLVFTVITPISSFSYPQSSFTIPRNEAFTCTPLITGYNPSYSIISGSLPMGLVLNSSTGVISGTPIQSMRVNSVNITAKNAVSEYSFTISFTVLLSPSSLLYPQSLYYLPINTSFITIPMCDGDNLLFQIQSGSLPSGLSLDNSTGTISGIPVVPTTLLMIMVVAHNEVGLVRSSLSILVQTPLSNLHYPNPSFSIVKGRAFSTIPVLLGDAPVFNVSVGTLPEGLLLNSVSGEISGIPLQTCTLSLIIQARNEVSFIETGLSFAVNVLATSTLILICIGVIVVILLIVLLITISKRKRKTLPVKSLSDVKPLEKRIVYSDVMPSSSVQPTVVTVVGNESLTNNNSSEPAPIIISLQPESSN